MAKQKNPAAVALGKARWAGVSAEELSAKMSALASAGAQKMTPEKRLARARKASKAAKKARLKKKLSR
jgi:hypothetical protein